MTDNWIRISSIYMISMLNIIHGIVFLQACPIHYPESYSAYHQRAFSNSLLIKSVNKQYDVMAKILPQLRQVLESLA